MIQILLAFLLAVLLPSLVAAQPNVTGVSGSTAHGGTLTITGTGFGSKSPAAPLIWVDAETGSASQHWSKIWPTTASNSVNNMAYRTTFHDVAQVHARSTRYAVGCHVDENTATGGNIVALSFTYQRDDTKPTYLNYRFRADPNWVDNGEDQNFKLYWANADPDPGMFEPYFYFESVSGAFTGAGAGPIGVDTYDSGNMGYRCISVNGVGTCGSVNPAIGYGDSVPNYSTQWAQYEHFITWSSTNSGRYQVQVNGTTRFDSNGSTDTTASNYRSESIGSYARARHANNCRYYDDLYVDRTFARVVLGNNANYSSTTVREPQPPTAWSDTEITITVNAASFGDGQTAYVFVCNASNQCDSSGYAITIGQTEEPPPPSGGGGGGNRPRLRIRWLDMGLLVVSAVVPLHRRGRRLMALLLMLMVPALASAQPLAGPQPATSSASVEEPQEPEPSSGMPVGATISYRVWKRQ